MMRALLLLTCLTAAAGAQVTVDVPMLPSFVNVDLPFPAGVGRYQQWYSVNSLSGTITEPMRFTQLDFYAGTAPTSQVAQINCEVLMGHGKLSGVSGMFDNNWASPPVVVRSQGMVQLSAGAPGQIVLSLPLTTQFTWDNQRPLLLEIRVFGNSLNNQPFNYNFRGTTQSIGMTSRVFAANNATATSGMVWQGWGMVTRFTARPGAVVPFGIGCPGEGGFVPVNTVVNIPWPGIAWNHTLSEAASQRLALWVIGDTNTAPFPVDLTPLFGLPASNCFLRTNPVNTAALMTVGGGAGTGVAQLQINLPGTTNYIGAYLYTQWVVFDPLAANGVLSVTPGVWSVVAPIGG